MWTEHPHAAYCLAHLQLHLNSHAPHGSTCRSACLTKTCSSTCHHVSNRSLSLHPLISSCLSSVSAFLSTLRLAYPGHHPPCGRNRRGLNPLRTRRMRRIAPWRHTLEEIMNGIKDEEKARLMVQNDLQTIEERIRQLEPGSGSASTVGSDADTAVEKGLIGIFGRPPLGSGIRLNDFLPRKMELKKWVTDYEQCSYQGLTETEVEIYQGPARKGTYQQRKTKTMVNIWFSNDTNLPTMIGLLDIIKRGTQEGAPQTSLASKLIQTGVEPEKKPLAKAHTFVLWRPQGGEWGWVQKPRCLC